MQRYLAAAVLAAGVVLPHNAHADWFGSGGNRFEIPFVAVGDPGNAADTTGDPVPAGWVDYAYQIGRYEVPEEAITKALAQSQLNGAPLQISPTVQRGPQKPATSLTWPEVARFVNWLNSEVGASPAYKFNAAGAFQLWAPSDPGYDPDNRFRNSRAVYFLPSADEWYKAAYYDPATGTYFDFATGSDTDPIAVASGTDPGTAVWNIGLGPADVELAGGASPYGVVGMSGNVMEFEETAFDLLNSSAAETHGARGGDWRFANSPVGLSSDSRNQIDLASRPLSIGFRVTRIPEPTAILMVPVLIYWAIGTEHRGISSHFRRSQ